MTATRIYDWARTQPQKLALVHNGIPIDYLLLARAIETHRLFFEKAGLPPRGTAVVIISNLADTWFAVLALRALGLDTFCAPSLAAAEAMELKNIACIVVAEAERATQDVNSPLAHQARTIIVPRMHPQFIAPQELPTRLHGAGGHIVYTSGTTGTNKKLLIDAGTQQRRIEQQIAKRSLDQDTLQHCGGFGLWSAAGSAAPLTLWHAGGAAVIDQRQNSLEHFFDYKITRAWLTPPLLTKMLDLRGDDARPVDGFDLSVGSGFLPLRLAERASRHLSRNISMGYSSTECSKIAGTTFRSEEDLYWLTPAPGRVIEFVDDDDRPCPVGQEGKVKVKLTETDCTGYLDDEETTERFFRDGYFYPGDLGVRRADGKIRILGRADDVLNVQGQKLLVAPLEDQVQRILGVGAVCLFAGLSNDGIDELVVAIEGGHKPDKVQIETLLRGFKQFERIRFAILDSFPRTEGGTQKVRRNVLRRQLFPGSHGA